MTMSDDAGDYRVFCALHELANALAAQGRHLHTVAIETKHPTRDHDVPGPGGSIGILHVRGDGRPWALVVEGEMVRRADK